MNARGLGRQCTSRVGLIVLVGVACFGAWVGVSSRVAADNVLIGPAASQPADTKVTRQMSAADMLKAIEKKPGYYSQMCGLPIVEMNQFSPYAFTRFEQRLSADDLALLREKRSEVVDLIRSKLVAARQPIRDKKRPQPAEFDESDELSHDLAILIDLNGVEALDALCDWAADLEIPQPPATTQAAESRKELWPGAEVVYSFGSPRIAEALSTITAVLRQEGCQPLLNSDIEKQYCDAVQKEAKSRGATLAPAKSEPSPYEVWDDRCRAQASFHPYCWIQLTPERRNQILGWARDYLKSTPPAKRKAAAGMSKWPILR